MREPMAFVAIAAAIGCVSGSACAMNSSEAQPAPSCQVIGGNKLPAASVGADALCREIAAATAEAAPGSPVRDGHDRRRAPASRAWHCEHGQATDGELVQALCGIDRDRAGESRRYEVVTN